jgi:predicted DNA-binding transcriptional regulator YafY
MRADRLLSILMLLQTKGRMTAHDLASQLEVSERTIYRDLEALSTAGVPVYTERGPGGGCSLIDGYQTRLTGLTDAEVRALFLFNLAGPLADLGLGRAMDDALLKLEAALPAASRAKVEQIRQRFHLDTTWWYHSAAGSSFLQTIQEALWQDHKLCLMYRESDGSWSEYALDPYGLVSKADIWYLVGICDNTYHVLRVSRIIRATLLDEQFSRMAAFNLAQYWSEYCAQLETNHPPYAVPLRLAPDDAASLPQLLSEWGYMLVESDDLVEPEEAAQQVVPFQQYHQKNAVLSLDNGAQWRRPQQKKQRPFTNQARSQQKKGHTPPRPQQKKPIPHNKKSAMFVLDRTGDWLVVDGGRPVAQSRNKRKKAPSQQKKNAGLMAQIKKTNSILEDSILEKNAASSFANKKKQFSRPIKKSYFYFPLATSLLQSA